MSENIFKAAKRHISQFFETAYWYRWRKRDLLCFDESTGKYAPYFMIDRAYRTLNNTWDCEYAFLNILLLKIEHTWYNMKKYHSNQDMYIFSEDLLKNEKDINWAWNYLFHNYIVSNKEICHGFNSFKKKLDKKNYENYLYLGKDQNKEDWWLRLKWMSGYFFICVGTFDKEQIDWKKIKKHKYFFIEKCDLGKEAFKDYRFIEDDKSKVFELAGKQYCKVEEPQYKKTFMNKYFIDGITCGSVRQEIENCFRNHQIQFDEDWLNQCIRAEQTFTIDWPDKKDLSEIAWSFKEGNNNTLIDLLHFRRLVKNALDLCLKDQWEPTPEGFSSWDKEKKVEYLGEQKRKHIEIRKECFRKVADFMAERGENWWD